MRHQVFMMFSKQLNGRPTIIFISFLEELSIAVYQKIHLQTPEWGSKYGIIIYIILDWENLLALTFRMKKEVKFHHLNYTTESMVKTDGNGPQ